MKNRFFHCLITLQALLCLASAEVPKLPANAVDLLGKAEVTTTKPTAEEGTVGEIPGGWRFEAKSKLAKSYNLAFNKRFSTAIPANRVGLLVLKARTVASSREDGKGAVFLAIQNTADYSKTPLWRSWNIGNAATAAAEGGWETSFVSFELEHPVPEGAGIAKVVLGETKQIIEVADLQFYLLPESTTILTAPQMKKSYGGRAADAAWRAAAAERIEKLRKGKMTVKVVDEMGQPVSGASVKIDMKRHLFGFGSSVDIYTLSGLGAKVPMADQLKYRDIVDELFSRIVPEMGLRVGNIDADPDPKKPWQVEYRQRTGAATKWVLEWAREKKMTSRGHYLSWGYTEPWAQEIVKASGAAGLMARYDRHFAHVLPFAAPYVAEWDALNHPVPFREDEALYNVVGPDVYPQLYGKIRPLTDKLLFVNEDTFNPDRAAAFEKHVRHMIAKGQQPDGCGFQSHFSDHAIASMDEQWALYERFGKLAKYLTVTEYDLQTTDDQLHADHMGDMLTLAFSHPQMTGFVIWGFWEPAHWKPMAAMFRKDWKERPVVKTWRDLVKGKWWTPAASLTSDDQGEAATQGFFGQYDVTIEKAGKSYNTILKHYINGGRPVLTLK
jgi:endo-1,4-beta-xylanase